MTHRLHDDDLVATLRNYADLDDAWSEVGPVAGLFRDAADTIEQLQRQAVVDTNTLERLAAWKESAMSVLAEWDTVWEAAGRPGRWGQSKAEATRQWIEAHR